MSNQPPLIQYTKKGPPYVSTGGSHHDDFSRDTATSNAPSTASERCSVIGCTNTFATQPPKIFVPFPTHPSKRTRWLRVIGLNPAQSPSHKLFCCEDHFDLKRDVMHLSTLRTVNSGIVPNLLKDSVIPHRHTNTDAPAAPRADTSAARDMSPPDEQMQVFITRGSRSVDTDPLSSSSEDSAVKSDPDPAPAPRIRVKSSYELMISSTTSLTGLPNACTRPPESERLQRTSVIHEPPMSPSVVMPTSVIRTTPHSPRTTTPTTSQVNEERASIVDGKLKYRECAVSGCPNNLRTFPNIHLVCVPIQDSVRKEWYRAIGRPFSKKSVRENIYVCTAHFREEELETVKPPFGKSGVLGPDQFHKRVKHGVLPTLNLIPSSIAGEVWANQPPSATIRANLPPRVPDLTPHSPALMAGAINTQDPSAAKPHAPSTPNQHEAVNQKQISPQLEDGPQVPKPTGPVSSKPVIPVQPRYQKYVAKTMPQYPECKHKKEEYQCSYLSVVDCSSFYSQFYSLDSRDEQNEFIFSHTEVVSSSSPELEQPMFKFFVDRKKSQGTNSRRVQVCAQAFSTCLSFEITALISLVTRHFDTIQSGSNSNSTLVLQPVKKEEGEDDDVMIYESVPQTLEIEDSPDEEKFLIKGNDIERGVESDVGRPLTVEEELRQTVRNVEERARTGGSQDQSENMDIDYERATENEPNIFETVHICRRCLAQFKSKAAFDEHESAVEPCSEFIGEFFKCTTCGRTLTTFEDLKVHTTVYHKYVCPKCSDTFRYRRYLEDHVVKCTGTNRLSDEMIRLIVRTKVMQHKIADTLKKESMALETVTSKVPGGGCSVVLEKLKITASEKRTYNLKELTDVLKGRPEEIPRLKIKAADNDAVDSPVSNDENRSSSPSPVVKEEDSLKKSPGVKTEPDEEVDVESTFTVPDENLKEPELNVKKRPKREGSNGSSSEEEVIRKHPRRGRRGRPPSSANPNPTPTRALRARKPISLAEPDGESDSEPIPELAGSGGDTDVDPDFDPTKSETRKGKKRSRKVFSDSDDTSDSENGGTKVSSSKKIVPGSVSCGQCNASFANVSGLRAHHRLSEKCGKFPPGTVFKCDNCSRMFISQTMLDEHRATEKQCLRTLRTPTPVDIDLLNCFHCNKSFNSLFNLRFHLKSSKECLASARLRSEADEVSSLDDTQSRASSSTSERRPHNLATAPHICKCCKVSFNSALGLGLHLKRSQKCIADNPDVDIPGVVDKCSVVDNSSGAAKKNEDQGVKKPNQDVVYVCVKCHSSFSSVWGLRTHERNSSDCKPDRPYEIPVPIPKEQADKLKKEYLAKQQKDGKPVPPSPPASSSSKVSGSENRSQKPGFLMVYTQECQDEDGKFKCKTCSALFTSVWGLRTHQRISESCMDKTTPRLPRTYQKSKIILSEAAAKSIAKGENICPNCSAKFSTSWGLRTHLRTSSICSENESNVKMSDSKRGKEGLILSCSKCEMIFLQLRQLRDHVKYSRSCLPEDVTISKNGRVQPGAGCFLCPQCPKTFKLPFSLEQHFVEHAPQKEDWLCHLCTKDFADQFVMHRHFHREHLGRWFCIMCEKKSVLSSFKDFYAHIFEHHASDPENAKKYFKCSTCYKSFLSKFSYDFHVNSCRKLAEQVFHCASCQKVFNKKIHITNHMKYAHTGVVIDKRYKFKCPRCPRKFLSEKDYLQKHEKESCVQEEMPCEICGEMYTGFEKLKMHLEIAHKKRSEHPAHEVTELLNQPKIEPDPSDIKVEVWDMEPGEDSTPLPHLQPPIPSAPGPAHPTSPPSQLVHVPHIVLSDGTTQILKLESDDESDRPPVLTAEGYRPTASSSTTADTLLPPLLAPQALISRSQFPLHAGRKSPDPGRSIPQLGRSTPELDRKSPKPEMAKTVEITLSSSSPAPSVGMQESPTSPEDLFSVSSVKLEPSSP